MEDVMYVVITLRKEVPDRETGRAVYDQVKVFLEDKPGILVTGHVSNHFQEDIT